jgi:hypothetical protein
LKSALDCVPTLLRQLVSWMGEMGDLKYIKSNDLDLSSSTNRIVTCMTYLIVDSQCVHSNLCMIELILILITVDIQLNNNF